MKVYKEVCSAYDCDFWSGAKSTAETLTTKEINTVLSMLEDCYPDGIGETELNDFFWFETDTIAEWLDWPDYETLYKARSGGIWYDTYEEYKDAMEEDEEEDEEE